MNYYIQGDAAKAEQIKAAFEKLGVASNANRYNYKNDYVLYFSAGGMIHMIDANGSWANIIKTHPDYQELELPVEPCFKAGDDIKTGNTIDTIAEIDHATRRYYCESGRTISFENQDLWHFVPKPHFNIKNFKPFDKVLVRDGDLGLWKCDIFSDYYDNFYCFRGTWEQCIPFEGNEHLLSTTDMPSEEYINW